MRKPLILTFFITVLVICIQARADIVTYQGRVTSNGTGFTGNGQFKFALVTVKNDAETATATANAPSGGFITVINVTYGGFGYVTPPAVTITGGGGSGATATASIVGGKVNSITVSNPGSGYVSTPSVTVAAPPPSYLYTTHWSHDGTSTDGSAPNSFINLPVAQGLFVAPLGDQQLANMGSLDPAVFQEPELHLRVWFNDGVNGFAAMIPTQPLTAAPYAIVAEQVKATGLSGAFANQVSFNNPGNSFTGSGAGITSLNASQLTSGTVAAARIDTAIARRAEVWVREGNTGTTPATDFIGTLDNQPLEFRINDQRALRLEPGVTSPNIVGGHSQNAAGSPMNGAVIGGGGIAGSPNQVSSDHGTVGGGYGNAIASYAQTGFIGGGISNTISGGFSRAGAGSTVAGGTLNTIINVNGGFIGGGRSNKLQGASFGLGDHATIGGGLNNSAAATASTIPGGSGNQVTINGLYGFAAGFRARVDHAGTFVWADSQNSDFTSTAANQFNVRASGGYRLFSNAGATTGVSLAAGSGTWTSLSDRAAKENLTPVDGAAVLEKVAALPLTTWNYRSQETSIRHLGPMAQDFHAAFSLGENSTGISVVDADGVALAAIQGLNEKVEVRGEKSDARLRKLEEENAELRRQNTELFRRIEAMEGRLK